MLTLHSIPDPTPDLSGEPRGTRTPNPLIKSPRPPVAGGLSLSIFGVPAPIPVYACRWMSPRFVRYWHQGRAAQAQPPRGRPPLPVVPAIAPSHGLVPARYRCAAQRLDMALR